MCTLIHSLIVATLLVLGAPLVADAAAPRNLVELGNMIAGIFNKGTTFLVLLAVVIYFAGVAVAMFRRSQGKVDDKGKSIFGLGAFSQVLLGGIIVIFIMVSIWGIIRVLQQTLFGNTNTTTTRSVAPAGTTLEFTGTTR